jgi:MoaD family protein
MNGTVTVHIPTPLRGQVDDQARLELPGGTVREVLSALTERYPKLRGRLLNEREELNRFVNVFLNEEDIRFLSNLDTPVKAGDGIMIVPAIAGGVGAARRHVRRRR